MSKKANMPNITAILHAEDVEATVDFYRTILGFDTNFIARDEDGTAFHAEVLLGGAPLMISSKRHLSAEGRNTPLGSGVIVQIDLDDDIDGYYANVVQNDAEILDPLADRYWGQRSFLMRDFNGYTLSIAMDVPAPE